MLTSEYLEGLPSDQAQAEILQEFIKCANDPIYCLENYFPVTEPLTGQKVPFLLYPFQKRALQAFERHSRNLTMKTRQTGFTTVSAAYTAWYMTTRRNRIVNALANKEKVSIKFLRTVRNFLDEAYKRTTTKHVGLDNKGNPLSWLVSQYAMNNNGKKSFSLLTETTISAESNNPEACRGDTINLLIIDEVAAITHMDDIWAAAGITLTRSRGTCIGISCVTKDTYVFTDKGIQQVAEFIPSDIDPTIQQGVYIEPYNILGKDKKRTSDMFYINGYGKTRKIITSYAEVECSLKHKFWAYKDGEYNIIESENLTLESWVNIQYAMNCWGNNDDISDFIPSKSISNRKEIELPSNLTPDWCYLFGLYIAEGNINETYNSIFISCGDGITPVFDNLGLSYYQDPKFKVRHSLNYKTLVEFFKYIGFNPDHKAPQKEIPQRLMSISKENMKALVQGIFDGDGFSTIKNNRVGINITSKKLIEQLRVILGNFGVLGTYRTETAEKLNTYFSKKGIEHKHDIHTLEINGFYATQFHKNIGFRLERKAQTIKESKQHSQDFIPNANELVRELCKLGKTSIDIIRTKHKIYIHYDGNPSKQQIEKLYDFIEEKGIITDIERFKQIKDQILIPNSTWVPIKEIIEGENYTFDFSLPKTDDFWCHSITYCNITSYQTPKGTSGWYFDQYTNAADVGWHIIDAHWSEHPDYKKGMYAFIKTGEEKNLDELLQTFKLKITSRRQKEEGQIVFFNSEWPLIITKDDLRKYKTKDTYQYISDGKLRSPWYDNESAILGINKTRCELDCTFAGSGGEVLDPDLLRRLALRARAQEPINKIIRGVWKSYREYEPYVFGRQYIITNDAATGDGSDFSAFCVLDITNCANPEKNYEVRIVATYKDQVAPRVFAEIIHAVGYKYGICLVILENDQGGGFTALTDLKNMEYPQIYYSTLKKKDPYKKERKRKPGFIQSGETRALGGDKLEEYINTGKLEILAIDVVDELHTWIWDKDGKRRHASGKNDDLIMCLQNGMYYICFVKNFNEQHRQIYMNSFERIRTTTGGYGGDSRFDKGYRQSIL
jgi:hypothetical protein